MSNTLIDPIFNLQRTEEEQTVGGKTIKVVTSLEVETALPLVVTQNRAKAGADNHLFVPESASLKVSGDEVTVSGKLKLPGKNVVIFARVLRAEVDGKVAPAICVDGAELPEERAKPKALPKGASPSLVKQKVSKGRDGDPGSSQSVPGQPGRSAADHPGEMNGEPGEDGWRGNSAGNVWILCQRTDFGGHDGKLGISAVGGPGGNGQSGQDGADGGHGGHGFNFKRGEWSGYQRPSKGGDGGKGGAAGAGGAGGQGGRGGSILVHCISALPGVAVAYEGGVGGAPGESGTPGRGGNAGPGGDGGTYVVSTGVFPATEKIDKAADGRRGKDGSYEPRGSPAPTSQAGSSSVTSGELKNKALAKLASVSQIQMLFERARADYLVTEQPPYTLRLMTVAAENELVDEGENLVVVAFVGPALRIRIFDADGRRVMDKPESELGARMTDLDLLRDVVWASNWPTTEQLDWASEMDIRIRAIRVLDKLTDPAKPGRDFLGRNSYDLIGMLWVTTFLLRQGIRDEQWLKTNSPDDHRNTLIAEIGKQPGVTVSQLQAMDNQSLARFAASKSKPFVPLDGPALAALKQRMGIPLRSIVQAGKWPTDGDLRGKTDADLLSSLPTRLLGLTNQTWFETYDNYDLTGMLAVATFLLCQGIQNEFWLKTHSLNDQRNALIAELGKHTDYTAEDLQLLDNHALVRLALVSKSDKPFVLSGSMAALRDSLQSVSEKDLSGDDRVDLIAGAMSLAGYTDLWTSIGERLDWVVRLLVDLPNEHQQKDLARRIFASAWTTNYNHFHGLDYFGKTPWFVPMGSFDTYRQAFQDSLTHLERIEEKNKAYFKTLKEQKDATNDLQAAVDITDKHLGFLGSKKGKIGKELKETGDKIDSLNSDLQAFRESSDTQAPAPAQPTLETLLKKLATEVNNAFGLSVETFFNCLSQLSFVNVHEPANAKTALAKAGGYASAGAMAVSQVGAMLSEGMQNVLDDSGVPVKKAFLLKEIDTIKQDLNLKAELTKRADANGYLSKGDSYRLLVELDKFSELCKEFYKLPDAPTVRQALDKYIDKILERNNHIDYYNALVRQLLDMAGEMKKVELQRTAVRGKLGEEAKPGLPAMATFVSGLYERAKAECIRELYYAYRAFAFWALKPPSGFNDLLGRSPGAITAVQLGSALDDITRELLEAIESSKSRPSYFPAKDVSEASTGCLVVLTKEMHTDFFDDLIESGVAEFELAPAMKRSPAPDSTFEPSLTAWCEATRPPLNVNHPLPNPFYGMANVRLTKVRVWMIGMKTGNGIHHVTLEHTGQEQFRRPDDLPYPDRTEPADEKDPRKRKPEYVYHEPTLITCKYKSEKLVYDPATNRFTPGELTEDTDLGFLDDIGLSKQSHYAPLGPFAMWELSVDEDNAKPDLSGLSMIVIDFHGFHWGFIKKS